MIIKKIKNLLLNIIESIIKNIEGELGFKLRRVYYSNSFGSCGKNIKISKGVVFEGLKDIYVGDNVWIDNYCILIAGKVNLESNNLKTINNRKYLFKEGELHLGSNIHLAPQCIIQSHAGISIGNYFTASAGSKIYSLSNNPYECHFGTHSNKLKGYVLSPISISENVWLGLNGVILGGDIGRDTFISTNSLVLSDVESNSYIVGSPGVRVKDRF